MHKSSAFKKTQTWIQHERENKLNSHNNHLKILRIGKGVLIFDPTVAELGNGVSGQAKSGAGGGLLEGELVTAASADAGIN